MYTRYAEQQRWKVEVLSTSESSVGGLKEVIAIIEGNRVFSQLKYESGVHRVQRVPATEQQGRVHTSAVTVAVLPEAEDVDIKIEAKDLRIDTFCSSGVPFLYQMRTALSVLLTCWPPAPPARIFSHSMSWSLMSTWISSGSGSTATVAAEVWMRPCCSVLGTRCTR